MSEWTGRKPDGENTDDAEEYLEAWGALAYPIADFLGMAVVGCDPDILLHECGFKSPRTMVLPVWFAKRLLRGIEGG